MTSDWREEQVPTVKTLTVAIGISLLFGIVFAGTRSQETNRPLPVAKGTVERPLMVTPVPTTVTLPMAIALPTADPALIERGLEVYRTSYCGACHSLAAIGASSTLAPAHDGLGMTAEARIESAAYTGNAATAAAYIEESIVDPNAYLVDGYALSHHRMPAFSHLTAEDLAALVHMLLQQ